MDTYPADIINQALWRIIDTEKYHRISIYSKSGRPMKYKGKICGIWCDPDGIRINFNRGFYGRRSLRLELTINVRDIRWADNPIDQEKFEDMCRELTPKLSGPESEGRMISSLASATKDESIQAGPDIIEVEGLYPTQSDIVIKMNLAPVEERTLQMFKPRWWHKFTKRIPR